MSDDNLTPDTSEQLGPSHQPLLIPGLLVVFVIVILEAIMLWGTSGRLTRAYEIVLYIGVAIVTGVLFWLLTPGSQGELNFTQLGIRLGGGAAIGASFMLLAWYLTDQDTNHVVVPVPPGVPAEFNIENQTPNGLADVGEVRSVSGRHYLYVEFQPGQDQGDLSLKYLNPNEGFITSSYRVTRDGVISKISPSE